MGCAASKRIEVAADVYHPPPSSFAVFDINAIKEPWLTEDDAPELHEEKPKHVPAPILEELDALESEGPKSWDDVSKALEDLKPTRTDPAPPTPKPGNGHPPLPSGAAVEEKLPPSRLKRKSFSFHTLEELDARAASKPPESRKTGESWRTELKKAQSSQGKTDSSLVKTEAPVASVPPPDFTNCQPVKQNIFLVKDKLDREREGKAPPARWDPLKDFPEKCPPGGSDIVVLYTTSLGGVRRTYEDCNRVRAILENRMVVFDERDVSLHGKFLKELKELLGEGLGAPRLFVKGRYVGGVDEVVRLNEMGRLGRLMSWAHVERGVGRQACEGCGGARFMPCLACWGSCKVLVGEKGGVKERCLKCNENGLIECPACVQLTRSE